MRIPYISLLAAGALAISGCAYGGLGLGYGDPYYGSGYGSPYGYGYGSPYGGGSISVGYGSYYGGYGGYGSPYGWYDNYYYPGSGYYVYDSYRRPHAMTSGQRSYWSSRSPALRTQSTTTRVKPNWSGFNRRSENYTARQTARQQRQAQRDERQQSRQQRRHDD